MERFVIIGAGQAGVQAAATLRSEGFAGALTMIGEESFPPYQRPPLSKAYLAGVFARERLFLKPDSFYAEAACDLRLSVAATAIDRAAKAVSLSDGATIGYDKLLLATGTRVRKLPIEGAGLMGVHYLRGIDDVDALRPHFVKGTRLAVIGGGYIGLEVAAVAVKHGLDVTIIETAPRVMVRSASPQLSAFYESEHRAQGVKLVLNAMAQRFAGTAKVEAVVTNAGSVPTDIVLVGVGVLPNCEIAQDAGIACNNGIVVDDYARTSDPDVFAAGDCTHHPTFSGERVRLESVQNAIDQAKHAALAMLGKGVAYREVPWFWSDQYDLKLQIAGLSRPDDVIVVRGDPATRKFSVFHLRGDEVAAVEAVNAAPDYIIGRRLIASRARVPAERLADVSIPVKSLA